MSEDDLNYITLTPKGVRVVEHIRKVVEFEKTLNPNMTDAELDVLKGKAMQEVLEQMREDRRTIQIVVVNAGEKPVTMEVGDDLAALQAVVGGYIQEVPFLVDGYRYSVVCNEEGRLSNLPPNRTLGRISFVGDIFFTKYDDEGELVSLDAADVQRLYAFLSPPKEV